MDDRDGLSGTDDTGRAAGRTERRTVTHDSRFGVVTTRSILDERRRRIEGR